MRTRRMPERLSALLAGLALALLSLAAATAVQSGEDEPYPDHTLLRQGSFAQARTPALPEVVRLVSYNLHGPPTQRIETMISTLREEPSIRDAAVLLLQEVNRGHRGSGSLDLDEVLAERLGMHYAYAFENFHPRGGGERGLAILSRVPLREVRRVLLPVVGPDRRRRIALGATVDLEGLRMRVYTLHLETRISTENRGRQIQGVLEDAARYPGMPVVIMGDFNTITGSSRRKMFQLMEGAGYTCPLPGDEKTFQQKFFFRFKLDWIWVKGIEPLAAGVEGHVEVSDHRPLWVDFRRPARDD